MTLRLEFKLRTRNEGSPPGKLMAKGNARERDAGEVRWNAWIMVSSLSLSLESELAWRLTKRV